MISSHRKSGKEELSHSPVGWTGEVTIQVDPITNCPVN